MKEIKKKSQYDSTKIYTKNYNKLNINVQLNRELIDKLKEKFTCPLPVCKFCFKLPSGL